MAMLPKRGSAFSMGSAKMSKGKAAMRSSLRRRDLEQGCALEIFRLFRQLGTLYILKIFLNLGCLDMFGNVGMIIWDVQANSFPKTSLFRVLFVASSHPLAKVPGSRLKGPNK